MRAWLLDHPGIELLIDLAASRITPNRDGAQLPFQIERFARYCLPQWCR